ncbi:VCBS repeat-containing protein, partial [Candidatus Micrarchaeota archaeon]|nr:VCBS repeat-containing protein [Candidatus Micrarchaeota archaeon]
MNRLLLFSLFLFLIAGMVVAGDLPASDAADSNGEIISPATEIIAAPTDTPQATIEPIPSESATLLDQTEQTSATAGTGGGTELANQQGKDSFEPNLKTDDSFSTSLFSGSFIYEYPFKVPPGTNGLQPTVKLTYNNQRASTKPTIAGNGWALSQSYIERNAQFTADTTDDNFTLTLDGSEYELVFSQADQKYHSKIETYLSINLLNTTGNEKGQYWQVRTKDGTTYIFGNSTVSEQVSTAGPYVYRWYLDSIQDINKNSIYFNYSENLFPEDVGVTYPTSIRYNNDLQREILFFYTSAPRPDARLLFNLANNYVMSRALQNVEIRANGALVRRYFLNYSQMDLTPSLFLTNITEYGRDSVSFLPSVSFSYNGGLHWEGEPGFTPPLITNRGADEGVRFYDMNGDGLNDLAQGKNAYYDFQWHSTLFGALNLGKGFGGGGWTPPDYFVIQNGAITDTSARTFDINGDGFTDFEIGKIYKDGSYNYQTDIHTNMNPFSGSVSGPYNTVPVPFVKDGTDYGVRVFDLNGDGLADVSYSKRYNNFGTIWENSAHINTGSGYTGNSNYNSPIPYLDFAEDTGARVIDVNGDGLTDLIVSRNKPTGNNNQIEYVRNIYLNTGNGWTGSTTQFPYPAIAKFRFSDPMLSTGLEFGDINGDGLEDVLVHRFFYDTLNFQFHEDNYAFINYGNSFPGYGQMTPCTTIVYGQDAGCRFVDVNGDGAADVLINGNIDATANNNNIKFTQTAALVTKGGAPYQLREIRGKFGSKITVNYTTSTSLNNADVNGTNRLPFNIWVVSSIKVDNGASNPQNYSGKTSYNYSGGMYYFPDKEFRGFAVANETLADGTLQTHFFHQDSGRKGMEFKTEIYDSNKKLFLAKESNWVGNLTSGYYKTYLASEATFTYDGSATPRITNTTYFYDDYGNILQKWIFGENGNALDDRLEQYYYHYNTSAWIVDKPSYYQLLSVSPLTWIRQTIYYYDGKTSVYPPSFGLVTQKEDFLAGGTNPITKYSYNSHGNLISSTDPKGAVSKFVYGTRDLTFTFPDQQINALNHTSNFAYDLGTGNLLSETDANGFTTTYEYDVFGRIKKAIKPLDSAAYPSVIYEYELDGVAPEKIKTAQRESYNADFTLDSYTFYDGLGNLIQQKAETTNGRQIVTDTYYDKMFRVQRKSNPYFKLFDANYSSPNSTVAFSSINYDALSRVVKTTNPENTTKNISYERWVETAFDENGNKKTIAKDAFGQIIEVHEFAPEEYITKYTYDLAGSLTNIQDAQGNNFIFQYDSLGRKIAMQDPDLGIWVYSYDATGNLVSQTDSRGITTNLQYDALNRLKKKEAIVEIYYFYDEQLKGTLSRVIAPDFTKFLAYDQRLRVSSQTLQIDSVNHTNSFEYDSMDRLTNTIYENEDFAYNFYGEDGNLAEIFNIIESFAYNEFGKTTKRVYANGFQTNMQYYGITSRLKKITTGSIQNLNYQYDAVGNVLSIDDGIKPIQLRMGYDPLNRLATATRNDTVNNKSYSYVYNYSSMGNILKISETLSKIVNEYSYQLRQPRHAPSSIKTIYYNTTPTASQTKCLVKPLASSDVTGEPNTAIVPSPTAVISATTSATVLPTAMVLPSASPASTISPTTASSSPTPTLAKILILSSSSKEILTMLSSPDGYCKSYSSVYPTSTETFSYDENGNLVTDGEFAYTYDLFNHLLYVINQSGFKTAKYAYDDSGNRISKKDLVKNETTYYISQNFEQVVNATGTFNTVYYFDGSTMVARKDPDGRMFYYHPDHLGSTTLVTNSSRGIAEETSYRPFG